MRRSAQAVHTAAVLAAISCTARFATAGAPKPMLSLQSLGQWSIQVDDAATDAPINGFIPQMIMGLTDEQNHSDTVVGYGTKSSNPGGHTLPLNGAPHYAIATIDSGSQADIITYNDTQAFNFDSAGRAGSKTQTIEGANGNEDLAISGAIGVYATDFSNGTVTNGAISGVKSGSLKGQWDVPVLLANPEDQLPNIIGSPILSQYRVSIQNTVPQHLIVGGTTTRTPTVSLQDFSASMPAGYSKLTLKTTDSGPPTSPYYINYDTTGPNDPDTPGAWTSLITNGGVSVTHSGTTAANQSFLLDTGAQLSLISNDTAASVGIYNASPANADFVVDVLGVGGVQQVPGYYLNNLTLNTQGGPIAFNHVPVLVLDVADPRDPSSAVPGILGTNLFGDRDLILNTNSGVTGQTFIGIGPQWAWKTNGSGSWSTAANWAAALPNGIDTQANFYGAITSAATVTVDSPMTVGSIAFDNTNRYTLAGPDTITLQVSVDQAQINVLSGSHTIAAPVVLASDVQVSVVSATSALTISGNISSSGRNGIIKSGGGTLILTGTNNYTGTTTVLAGAIELAATARSPILSGGGADVQHGRLFLDYTSAADDPAATVKTLLTSSHASNFATGQIHSSTADATHALGWIDNTSTAQVTIAYTYLGDANCDCKVDIADLGALATSYGKSAVWSGGDFNYDGVVNIADLGVLATNYGLGSTSPLTMNFNQALIQVEQQTGVYSLPEPGMALLLSGIALALRRRRC